MAIAQRRGGLYVLPVSLGAGRNGRLRTILRTRLFDELPHRLKFVFTAGAGPKVLFEVRSLLGAQPAADI
jgi:hypothetical protein